MKSARPTRTTILCSTSGEPPAGGSFRDSQAQETNSWFAPQTIAGSSEQFVVQVLITDRNCATVPDLADRQHLRPEEARVLVENFLVEVVQREPCWK